MVTEVVTQVVVKGRKPFFLGIGGGREVRREGGVTTYVTTCVTTCVNKIE